MNIFILDEDPVIAAQMQCDKHVVKMTLETAQLLSSAVILNNGIAPYKMTHKNHPSTVWAAATKENFLWLVAHGEGLAAEYTFRYGKTHKCQSVIEALKEKADLVASKKLMPFALAMPRKYKNIDAVLAYRAYYLGDKQYMAKWTKRAPPDWWQV